MKEDENSKWLDIMEYKEKIQQKVNNLESKIIIIKNKQKALSELAHALNVLNTPVKDKEEILLSTYERVFKQIEAL